MIVRAGVFAKQGAAGLTTSASCEARSAAVDGGVPIAFNTQPENQTRIGDHAEMVRGLMLSFQARRKGMKQG